MHLRTFPEDNNNLLHDFAVVPLSTSANEMSASCTVGYGKIGFFLTALDTDMLPPHNDDANSGIRKWAGSG